MTSGGVLSIWRRTGWQRLEMDMQALEHTLRKPSEEELTRQHAAATRIQKAYRKSLRTRYLASDFLWTDLATHARMKVRHLDRLVPTCLLTHRHARAGRKRCRGAGQELQP